MNQKPLKFRAPAAGIAEAQPRASVAAGDARTGQPEAGAGDLGSKSGAGQQPRPASEPSQNSSEESTSGREEELDSAAPEDDPKTAARRTARKLKRDCERVLLLEPEKLSMPEWPADSELAKARRRRDMWVALGCVGAIVFLAGFVGVVPPWVAGAGVGLCLAILAVKLSRLDRLASSTASYSELISLRRRLIRRAREHVAFLESDASLAWSCSQMAPYNTALRSGRFDMLAHLSMQKRLVGNLQQRKHFRLYLIFMLEAEKAYRMLDIDAGGEDDAPDSALWQEWEEPTDGNDEPPELDAAPGQGSTPGEPELDNEPPQT